MEYSSKLHPARNKGHRIAPPSRGAHVGVHASYRRGIATFHRGFRPCCHEFHFSDRGDFTATNTGL